MFQTMTEAEKWVAENMAQVKRGFKVKLGQRIKWVVIGSKTEGFKIVVNEAEVIERVGMPGSISTDYIVNDGNRSKVYRWQIVEVLK